MLIVFILMIGVWYSPTRCTELLFWEETTCITSKSTTDLRRDITTYQLIFLLFITEPGSEMSLLLVSADQFQRLSDSTSLELRRSALKVMWGKLSSCSETISLSQANQLVFANSNMSLDLWMLLIQSATIDSQRKY